MAYDERLAERVRRVLGGKSEFSERKMFGGVAFLVGGHMCCGVVADDLMLRVGAEAYADALSRPHAREMDFTGRPMTGMVYVDGTAVRTSRSLEAWLGRALGFVVALPPRKPKRAVPARRARAH